MYTQLCEEKNPDPELENADPPPNRNDPDPQDWSETTVSSCAWVKEKFKLHNISG